MNTVKLLKIIPITLILGGSFGIICSANNVVLVVESTLIAVNTLAVVFVFVLVPIVAVISHLPILFDKTQ